METMNYVDQKLPFLTSYDTPNPFPLCPPVKEPFPYNKELLDAIVPWYSEGGIKYTIVGSSILAELTRVDVEELVEDTRVVSIRKLSPRLMKDMCSFLFPSPLMDDICFPL